MWTIQKKGGLLFEAPIDQRYAHIVQESNTPPYPAKHIQRQLKLDLQALNKFAYKLEEFLSNANVVDPTRILHKVYEPGQGILIPGIYKLPSDEWEAYFRLDFIIQTATGIYIRDVNAPLTATLASILAAL